VATEDESQLKKKARWRLIGAVALALLAFVALPLLFDSAPQPLGRDVEISIAMAPPPLPPMDPAAVQQGTEAAAPPALPAPTVLPAAKPAPKPAEKASEQTLEKVPENAVAKPVANASPKPVPKESKPVPADEPQDDGKLLGEKDYFLQLGVFGKEENARALAEKARGMGYRVTMIPVGNLHRVRVVGFNSRDQALAAKQALKQKGIAADVYGSD
jgi:DedD protein